MQKPYFFIIIQIQKGAHLEKNMEDILSEVLGYIMILFPIISLIGLYKVIKKQEIKKWILVCSIISAITSVVGFSTVVSMEQFANQTNLQSTLLKVWYVITGIIAIIVVVFYFINKKKN